MTTKASKRLTASDVLGAHPSTQSFLSGWLAPTDAYTQSGTPHRGLAEAGTKKANVPELQKILVKHHASKDKLNQAQKLKAILSRRGFAKTAKGLRLFPKNENTQKGNLAEVFLSEYLDLTGKAKTLVYRLRFNTNVDQSMKGDDVLAFNFDGAVPEIVVGETKFRATPSKAVVQEIYEALETSHKAGVPMSLQFVADRLYEAKSPLAAKVLDCAVLLLQRKAIVDFAGLLLSDETASECVNDHTPTCKYRGALISVSISNPDNLVKACFKGIEKAYGFDPG